VRIPAAVAATMIAVACGGSTSDGGGPAPSPSENLLGSCDTRQVDGPSRGQCRYWVGSPGADLEVSCSALGGVFSGDASCPARALAGRCAVGPTLGRTAMYGYYAPDYTESTARQHCTGVAGAFTPEGAGGAAGSRGAAGAAGSTGGCPPECFRPVECVRACGEPPVTVGCCPCTSGTFDAIGCP